MNRIKGKIEQINQFIDQLKDIAPPDIGEYRSNLEKKAACERYIEKIIEAAVDLAFLLIKIKKFEMPQDDADAFNILLKNGMIDDRLAIKLKAAKGMRNIITHEYGKINDETVFHSITEELESDMMEFLNEVEKSI